MKKVLIITNIPSPYRLDFFYYLQTSYLEYYFEILYSSENEDNRKWNIENNKLINSHFLKSYTIKIHKNYDDKYIHIPLKLRDKLNKINPDIIVGSEYNPVVFASFLWCKKHEIPFVHWTDGTLNSEKNINIIQKWIRKLIIKNSTSFIASSKASKRKLIEYQASQNKIFISHLTINIERYKYCKKKSRNTQLIYVGSLIQRKGVDLLFYAMKKVKHNCMLTIIGNGQEEQELKKIAKELDLGNRIIFKGYLQTEAVIEEYKKSDIFVLPTREDCFGLVTLEAMCTSLPVICSKYSDATEELVENGVNGYIIDPYNSREFSNAIDSVCHLNGEKNLMGLQSYEKVNAFAFENVSREYIASIRLALKK